MPNGKIGVGFVGAGLSRFDDLTVPSAHALRLGHIQTFGPLSHNGYEGERRQIASAAREQRVPA